MGVTGPPGAGKSTLVTALVAEARAQGRTVAVLAVDPSSPITGGAILGDRIRMQQHAADDGVFIRSMATRGHAGGLAVATVDAASVLDACGFGLVLIETVGTGQGEVEVASLADTTIVCQAPGMGDEVQAIKAGLLEVADIVAVTKADRPGADQAAASLRAMLTVGAQHDRELGDRPRPRRPEVLLVSAVNGVGVRELLAAIDRRAPVPDGAGEQTLPPWLAPRRRCWVWWSSASGLDWHPTRPGSCSTPRSARWRHIGSMPTLRRTGCWRRSLARSRERGPLPAADTRRHVDGLRHLPAIARRPARHDRDRAGRGRSRTKPSG